MAGPQGFSWIEKPLLAALARPSSPEDFQWLRAQGIEGRIAVVGHAVGIDMSQLTSNW